MAPANATSRALEKPSTSVRRPTEHGLTEIAELKRTPHNHRHESIRAMSDGLFSLASVALSVEVLARIGAGTPQKHLDSISLAILFCFYPLTVVFCCHMQRLYKRFPNVGLINDVYPVFRAVGLAGLLTLAFFSVRSGVPPVSWCLLALTSLNFTALLVWRFLARRIYGKRVRLGRAGTNILIIGASRRARQLADYLQTNHQLGYVVKGFLDDDDLHEQGVLGRVADLPGIARAQYVDEIFVTIPSHDELAKKAILTARKFCLDVTLVPELFEGLGFQEPLEYVGEFPVMELHRVPIPNTGLAIKRMIDVLIGSVALLLAAPLVAILAVLIYFDSPGPIFYTSKRVGKKGRIFGFYKMRSMIANADALQDELAGFNERDGMLFKMENDPRVTSVGRFLRKYSLDELPQLWNVLKGDMSLVGPRPPLVAEYANYRLEHKRRLDVVPGITGLWQVSNRHDPSFEAYLSQDLKYIENWDLWMDFEILLRTIPAVIRGTGY